MKRSAMYHFLYIPYFLRVTLVGNAIFDPKGMPPSLGKDPERKDFIKYYKIIRITCTGAIDLRVI